MNRPKPDLAKAVNKGHAALLSQLGSLKVTDKDFPYWLSSAALRFCVSVTNVMLQGKLKHVDALEKEVKKGFQEMENMLSDLTKEERDHAKYCLARFTKVSDEKANKSRSEIVGKQTCYDLRSKGSIAKTFGDPELENKVKATTSLKNEKTPRDLESRQTVSRASTQLTVRRSAGVVKIIIVIATISVLRSW